jgi:hypothetical protein
MEPKHRFEEDPFSQTSSISYVGGQIRSSESFDPLVDVQSQLNATSGSTASLSTQVNTLNTQVSTLNAEVNTITDSGAASFQQAYIAGVPLTTSGGDPLFVWAHT